MYAKVFAAAVVLLLIVIAIEGVVLIMTLRAESRDVQYAVGRTEQDECGTRFTQPCEVRVVD